MLFGYDKCGTRVHIGDKVRCVDTHYMSPEDANRYFQYPSDVYIIMNLGPTTAGGVPRFCDICRCRDGELSCGWFVTRFKLVSTEGPITVTRRLTVKQSHIAGVRDAGR